jgi:magnesium transporter
MKNDHSWKELAGRLKSLYEKKQDSGNVDEKNSKLRELFKNCDAANIALAIEDLETANAITTFKAVPASISADVLALIDPQLAEKILKHLEPAQVDNLIQRMRPKDAASVIADAPKKQQKNILKEPQTTKKVAADAKQRTSYPKNSAGHLMTSQFLRIARGKKIKEALDAVRQTHADEKIPEDIYIVSENGNEDHPVRMYGVISIRQLLMHEEDTEVDDVMEKDIVCIRANDSQIDAAALLSKYRFKTLPVVDNEKRLIGVIPVDELLKVMIANLRNLYTKAVGTDAQKMSQLSSFQEAKMRAPWLLVTMAIELIAGLVIHRYDAILTKVILLASFMPVISAISGNVGLQAAAITVRAVDSKLPEGRNLFKSVTRELATSLFMAIGCGIVLGIVGDIWAKHIPFGLVIGGALICSMLTAGLMGTVIPILSKRLGFDPATTAGPFETALQDIVGFGVFLWLATVFQSWIT